MNRFILIIILLVFILGGCSGVSKAADSKLVEEQMAKDVDEVVSFGEEVRSEKRDMTDEEFNKLYNEFRNTYYTGNYKMSNGENHHMTNYERALARAAFDYATAMNPEEEYQQEILDDYEERFNNLLKIKSEEDLPEKLMFLYPDQRIIDGIPGEVRKDSEEVINAVKENIGNPTSDHTAKLIEEYTDKYVHEGYELSDGIQYLHNQDTSRLTITLSILDDRELDDEEDIQSSQLTIDTAENYLKEGE